MCYLPQALDFKNIVHYHSSYLQEQFQHVLSLPHNLFELNSTFGLFMNIHNVPFFKKFFSFHFPLHVFIHTHNTHTHRHSQKQTHTRIHSYTNIYPYTGKRNTFTQIHTETLPIQHFIPTNRVLVSGTISLGCSLYFSARTTSPISESRAFPCSQVSFVTHLSPPQPSHLKWKIKVT